jgi:hypothetical protein
MQAKLPLLLLILLPRVFAQSAPSPEATLLQAILQRMDALEKQNQQMAQELHDLRQKLEAAQQPEAQAATKAPIDERVAVTESRVEEQAQTKVEASQKLPITITGQLLFNVFSNTGNLRPLPDAVYSPYIATANSTGATARQTMLGFDFRGPILPGDGKVNGHIMLDFYSGIPSEQFDWVRMRTSDISLDWTDRSFTFAYDKPLIAPRQPSSLAEVAIPPLAGAGNLWLWLPQVRYEERRKLGKSAGLTAQGALLQTDETYNYVPGPFAYSLEKSRPAVEGRLGFWKSWNERQRLEVATGFHASASHVAQTTAASRIFSVDWLATPFSKLEISGTYFHGQNFAGLGALSNGFSVSYTGDVIPVHGDGGWTQFSSPLTNKLTFNLFAGFQNNRSSDVQRGNIVGSLSYAGNLMFHLSQNVIVSVEALQMRSRLSQNGDVIRNRYDLALAYLF